MERDKAINAELEIQKRIAHSVLYPNNSAQDVWARRIAWRDSIRLKVLAEKQKL